MATLDNLSSLFVSSTSIKSSVKNISNVSSVLNTTTKNFNDFTTNLTDLSTEINDFSTNIMDMSEHFTDLSSNVYDFSSNMMDLSTTNNLIINIGDSLDQVSGKLNTTDTASKKTSSSLSKLVKSVFSLDNITKGMDMVNQYINTDNELSRINDGLHTQIELQNKVNAAANRSCGTYSDLSSAISNIGDLDTFSDNNQAIAFTELMQKSLKMEGSDQSISDVSASLADGTLQGDEFSSLISSTPIIGEALSASTGKSIEQLQEMADQGMITANLLKNAMFAAGDEIDSEFNEQPKTFADIWMKIKNSAINALNPLMELVSNIINSPGVQGALNMIINTLGFVSQAMSNLISFITDNWSMIQPILIAIGIYLAYIGGTALIGLIQSLFGVVAAEWATIAPILLIIGLIAGVIYLFQTLGVSVEDIFGFIGGVIGVTIAGVWNLFLGLFEFIIGILNYLINPFIEIANFLGNIFTNPISSIVYLFQGMADNVLGIIESIASALDMVFGTKMAETVSGWRSGLKDMADAVVEEYAPEENYTKIIENQDLSIEDLGLSRMDYSESWNAGSDMGKDLYGNISGILNSLSLTDTGYDYSQFETTDDLGTSSDPMNVEGSVNVDMEDEDLSYLRDMAERDYIANIATNTLAPKISVSFGDVHETADVNQLFGRIQTILKEQIAIAPEGVY
jgi:tape measure domain-containing protein